MKKAPVFFVFYFICTIAIAQNFTFDWVNIWNESENANGLVAERLSTDAENNFYVAGKAFYAGTIDFDPGPGQYNLTVADNFNGSYIAKFNTYGELQWATIIETNYAGSSALQPVEIQDIKATPTGEVYVIGFFVETLSYQGIAEPETKVSNGAQDIFFGKLNQNGEWEWMKTYGDIYDDKGESISITDAGDIYVTGYFAENVQFDPTVPALFAKYYDMFILKFNGNDQLQWVYSTEFMADNAFIYPSSIEVDNSGSIYITGRYWEINENPLDFDPGPGIVNLLTTGNYNAFLMKLDASTNLLWVKGYASETRDDGFSLALDDSENILMTGRLATGTIDFDTTVTGEEITSVVPGAYYLLKLAPDGTFIWVKEFLTSGFSIFDSSDTFDLVLDHQDNIFLQAKHNGTLDLDPGPDEYIINKVPGASYDGFLVKLDANGNFIQGQTMGTSSSDNAYGLTVDTFGNVYGALRTGSLSSDYSIDFGNLNYTASGNGVNFFYKITNCGQELVHDLGDGSFYADASNATYQWLDCDNGSAPIAGETNRTFTPTATGNYALQATNYNCVDVSPCFSFSTLDVIENDFISELEVFPNPTDGAVNVTLGNNQLFIKANIYTVTGQLVSTKTWSNTKQITLELNSAPGLYFIDIINEQGVKTQVKLIKK